MAVIGTVDTPEIFICGRYSPEDLSGVQGRNQGGGLGILSPRSWSSLQTLFTDFHSRYDQNV